MSGGAKKNLFNIAIVLAISIGFIIWQFQGVDISTFCFDVKSKPLVALGGLCCNVYLLVFRSGCFTNCIQTSE